MKARLAIVFALIVLVPLALLVWIGVEGVRSEREVAERRREQYIGGRLADAAGRIVDVLGRRERELGSAIEALAVPVDPARIRDWLRRTPWVSNAFVLGADRKRVHPPRDAPLGASEQEFLTRAGQVWRDANVFYRVPEVSGLAGAGGSAPGAPNPPDASAASGWYSWYWGNGINVLFWERVPAGHVYGFELDRMRLIADVVAALPTADPPGAAAAASLIRLVDSQGETLYQWGSPSLPEGKEPASRMHLAPPLNAWRLEYVQGEGTLENQAERRLLLNLVGALAAIAVLVVGLAVYFYRESSRDLREAAQRVSCVNQVSHELKSPLTNIRMYSELLQSRLPGDDEKAAEYIGIVVEESERLSRLIGNILTFSRKQQNTLAIRRRPGVVDATIAATISHLTPSLAARGLSVAFQAGAPGEVAYDPDALEQIVGNLLSNAEKYAPNTGVVEVTSREADGTTTIAVADRGLGIPWRSREEIFKPFRRLANALTEGVSGSGLGLPIARELARLHGGDVRLVPSERGARFEVTLVTPRSSA